MPQVIKELISTIQKIKSSDQFHRYIDFIYFPYYRNIEIDTKINFYFPLTVFIGQNGCGKSSCLHALYGAPEGNTPSKFWFDTKVDPIDYFDDLKKRHSFWYSFKDENGITNEVLKARIKRKDDPNYWETSRPLVWAGMEAREDRNDRDSPIAKKVLYLDFRAELSAFDQYFYFGNLKNSSSRNKQEFIRRKSISLKNLFSGQVKNIYSSSRSLNKPLESLTNEELKWISFVLGRIYNKGLSVKHSLFRTRGYSVLFQTDFAKYSEAVAGSGEMAVVRLVREVLASEKFSLILLDEPEVSLHPGAQERLKIFLLEQIKQKKHQIVITSHSPTIVKGLPKEAIKVFYQNPKNGRFLIKENLSPEEAFYFIQYPIDNKKNIIVEDILAKEIIISVLKKIGDETNNLFNIKYNPGGASVIKKEFIPVFCRETNLNDYVFFDGDQKPANPHYDWQNFAASDLNISFLRNKIKEQIGEDVKFSVDSRKHESDEEQQIELLKKYLNFYFQNVFYFPKKTPEDIIWDCTFASNQIKAIIPDPKEADNTIQEMLDIDSAKEKFAYLTKILLGNNSSRDISSIHRQFIQRWLNHDNLDFEKIKESLSLIISR